MVMGHKLYLALWPRVASNNTTLLLILSELSCNMVLNAVSNESGVNKALEMNVDDLGGISRYDLLLH